MINNTTGVRGRFKMVAIRPDGTERELAPWQDNLVTDRGLNCIGGWTTAENSATDNVVGRCAVGGGATPPAPTDEQLVALIAWNSTSVSGGGGGSLSGDWYRWTRQTFVFNAGVAAGNLTEVGLGQGITNPSGTRKNFMFSRALIKNTAGDPITVTVLPDEILQVVYELRFYMLDRGDSTSTIMDGAIERTVVTRPYGVYNQTVLNWPALTASTDFGRLESYLYGLTWRKGSGAVLVAETATGNSTGTAVPSVNSSDVNLAITHEPYVPGSYERYSQYRIVISQGAHSDIRLMISLSAPLFNWQWSFSPSIDKAIDEVVQFRVRNSWARYTG